MAIQAAMRGRKNRQRCRQTAALGEGWQSFKADRQVLRVDIEVGRQNIFEDRETFVIKEGSQELGNGRRSSRQRKGAFGKISRNAVEADKQTFGERQAGVMGK
jgi:hypothetical protein